MEALSRIMLAIVHMWLLSGFSVGSRNNAELVVCHLLFADDRLISLSFFLFFLFFFKVKRNFIKSERRP
jgi:hypothetical protein